MSWAAIRWVRAEVLENWKQPVSVTMPVNKQSATKDEMGASMVCSNSQINSQVEPLVDSK